MEALEQHNIDLAHLAKVAAPALQVATVSDAENIFYSLPPSCFERSYSFKLTISVCLSLFLYVSISLICFISLSLSFSLYPFLSVSLSVQLTLSLSLFSPLKHRVAQLWYTEIKHFDWLKKVTCLSLSFILSVIFLLMLFSLFLLSSS